MKKKFKDHIQTYEWRQHALRRFVRLVHPRIECDIVPLHDMFGPSTERPDLTAIVVSRETEEGGHKVNEKRKEKGGGGIGCRFESECRFDSWCASCVAQAWARWT